jgi:hypothetical protein
MANAIPEILELQRKVFTTLNEPLEQVLDTCAHGEFLTKTMRAHAGELDAVVFFDVDCIPLKPGVVARAVRLAVEKNMIIGCAQQANHIEMNKLIARRKQLPTLTRKVTGAGIRICAMLGLDPFYFPDPFIYAGPFFLVIPSKVYKAVGEPTLACTSRADAAGELTIACREHGIQVKCLQPTFCHVPRWKLGNEIRFGLGTIYGHCIFHAFETTYLSNQQSAGYFKQYCQKVINRFQASSPITKDNTPIN